jgi:hypothetical protein
VNAATLGTLNPALGTCTSRRIGVVRLVHDGGEGPAGGGGGDQIGEEKGGRVEVDGYSFGQGHFKPWSTCWRLGLVYPYRRWIFILKTMRQVLKPSRTICPCNFTNQLF